MSFLFYVGFTFVKSSLRDMTVLHASQSLHERAGCFPATPPNNIADRISQTFASGGSGTVVSLCPSTTYPLYDTINFTAANQELSTMGYPTDNSRATLVVSAPLNNDNEGMTTAIDSRCDECDGVVIRNIQVYNVEI